MVYTYNLNFNEINEKNLNPDTYTDTKIKYSFPFIWLFNFEGLNQEDLVGYVPIIYLVTILIIFIFFSSLIIWKKNIMKYDLSKQLTRLLNQIILLTILINYLITTNLESKTLLDSYIVYEKENHQIHQLICFFFIVFLIISWEYFLKHSAEISIEFPILFFISYIAMFTIITNKEIFIWFLSLELMSFSFYTLAGYRSKRFFIQTEGSLKYFIIGSIASSLFIFGLSLIYINFATVDFNNLISLFYFSNSDADWLGYFGILLILVAISFKLGIAPFHLWLPEVYNCSTSIVTLFFLVIPKLTLVYLLLQFAKMNFDNCFNNYFLFIYVLTFLMGTLSSLRQKRIDKFIGYSSIANNAWFVLIIANNGDTTFLWFYMFVSSIITILIYSPILILRKSDNSRLITNLRDLLTLKKTNPVLALLYSMAFFSLAGIPPFIGFFSKFFLLLTSVDKGYYFWVILAIVFSVFSCYYYIRMIKIMYFSNYLKFSYQKPLKIHTALIISVFSYINILFIFFPKIFLLFFYISLC